jgi:hypothetical protein
MANEITTLNAVGKDSIASTYAKIAMFNNYILEYTSLLPGNIANPARNALTNVPTDIPLAAKLIYFTSVQADNSPVPVTNPILTLPVNPDTFQVTFKKRSDAVYTLGGFVLNHWHDDITLITAKGYIPSFKGKAKILTQSYQAFLQFMELYKSCGQTVTEGQTLSAVPSNDFTSFDSAAQTNGSSTRIENGISTITTGKDSDVLVLDKTSVQNAKVQLIYQHDVYEGIFTDLIIEESYEQPNTLQYTFNFKAISHKNVMFDRLGENLTNAFITNLQNGIINASAINATLSSLNVGASTLTSNIKSQFRL